MIDDPSTFRRSLALSLVTAALTACGADTVGGDHDAATSDAAPDVDAEAPDATDLDVVTPDAPPLDIVTPDAPPLDIATPDAPPLDIVTPDAPLDIVTPDAPPLDIVTPDAPLDVVTPPDVMTCATPMRVCGALCVDLSNNPANCGACGNACLAGQGCLAGRCVCACPSGQTCCGSPMACVDVQSDARNCGACGRDCNALPGVRPGAARCVRGACDLTGACVAGRASCATPTAGCTTDITAPANCGACGAVCPAATPLCAASPTGTYACSSGCAATAPTRCGSACVNTATSVSNCGACGVVCPAPAGSVATCTAGRCGFSCGTGYHLCGAACALNTSVASCGASCTPCAAVANGVATCNGTACDFVCNAGFMRSGATCVPMASVAAPRPVWPPSTSTVTSRRPAFRWALAAGSDGARVDVCRDRACATVVTTFDISGATGAPPADLPAGSLFWRLRGRLGTTLGTVTSVSWPITVGARTAPVSTAWGSVYDPNGDGLGDILVGAPGTGGGTGRSWIYAGRAGAGINPTQLTRLTGLAGANAYYGNSVSSAGDINGDGYADTVIGSYLVGAGNGRVDLYLGAAAGPALVPSNTVTGPDAGAYFGYSVANAGDINADGYGDLIVGGYLAAGGAGRAYVYYGNASGIPASPSLVLASPAAGGSFGISVASAGDVNGDGFADVIIGASSAASSRGAAYVYLGSAAGLQTPFAAGFTGPDAGGSFGYSVAGAGDVNGDGYTDVIVGAYNAARAYVFHGSATGLEATASEILSVGTDGLQFGMAVDGVGDTNGDGYTDVLVGAPLSERAYLFLGGATGLNASTPALTISVTGTAAAATGRAVARLGDVNRDGRADLAVGVPTRSQVVVYRGGVGVPTLQATLTNPYGTGTLFGTAIAWLGAPRLAHGHRRRGRRVRLRRRGRGRRQRRRLRRRRGRSLHRGATRAGRVHVFHGSAAGVAATPTVSIAGPDGADSLFGSSID
ncbi:MAG: FG-GAP-like repeat-containing protein [Polyangiales bacterium]